MSVAQLGSSVIQALVSDKQVVLMLRDGTRLAGRVLDLQGIVSLGVSPIAGPAASSTADKSHDTAVDVLVPELHDSRAFLRPKHRPGTGR
jgi:hypothetical protein